VTTGGSADSAPPDGRFWVSPDIVVRSEDDGVFVPDDPDLSSLIVAGQDNYVYVQVVNKGPQPARSVRVDVRIAVAGLAFRYPADWHTEDDSHVWPEAVRSDLLTMEPGVPDRAVFAISASQADRIAEWAARDRHPCLLAQVMSDNDYAFRGERDGGDTLVARRNNLAQRNLRVVSTTSSTLTYAYSVDAAHEDDASTKFILRVEAGALARDGRVELCVDGLGPSFGGGQTPGTGPASGHDPECQGRIRLLDPARVETDWCGCRAVVSLTPGTEIALSGTRRLAITKTSGVEPIGTNCVRLTKPEASIVVRRAIGTSVPATSIATARSRNRSSSPGPASTTSSPRPDAPCSSGKTRVARMKVSVASTRSEKPCAASVRTKWSVEALHLTVTSTSVVSRGRPHTRAACAPKTYHRASLAASAAARSYSSSAGPAGDGTQGLSYPLVDRKVVETLLARWPVRPEALSVCAHPVRHSQHLHG